MGLQGNCCFCSEVARRGAALPIPLQELALRGTPDVQGSAFAMAVGSLQVALGCPKAGGCLLSSTYLVIHLLLHFQRERVVHLWAQHVWAHTDGQIAGVHLVGLGILADAVEQREQVLEQDKVWSGQFVSQPV